MSAGFTEDSSDPKTIMRAEPMGGSIRPIQATLIFMKFIGFRKHIYESLLELKNVYDDESTGVIDLYE